MNGIMRELRKCLFNYNTGELICLRRIVAGRQKISSQMLKRITSVEEYVIRGHAHGVVVTNGYLKKFISS